MENKKLQYLSPYLPFNLKIEYDCKVLDKDNNYDCFKNVGFLNTINIHPMINSHNCTPLLRSLNDVNKEILVDGKKITPLEVIGQDFIQDGFIEDGAFGWGQPTGGDDEQDYYLTIEKENNKISLVIWCGEKDQGGYVTEQYKLSYDYYTMLLKWNFDVFGLLEQGLAKNIKSYRL